MRPRQHRRHLYGEMNFAVRLTPLSTAIWGYSQPRCIICNKRLNLGAAERGACGMQTIMLREAQAPYTVTVDEQALRSDATVLEQNGQPLAVLLPIGEYEAFRAWQQRQQAHSPTPAVGFAQERAAFERLLPQLIQTYPDRVVAIYGGQVVEIGDDVGEVLQRVHARYGYVACYMGRAQLPGRVYKMTHRRIVR